MDLTEKPDPANFSVNERKGEFRVLFDLRGTITMTIEAASKEEAREKARAQIAEFDEFGAELDQIDEIDICHIAPYRPMFLVTRDGQKMQVSRLEPGDVPREPDERGF